MKNPVLEKSELAIDALHYANEHNLDINNKDDVKKILEAIDPESVENIDEFAEFLKNSEAAMEIVAKEKGPKKTDLTN